MTNILQVVRESKGLSQEEVARRLNISLRQYQRIENAISKPNVYTALKLCKIIDANPYQIFPV